MQIPAPAGLLVRIPRHCWMRRLFYAIVRGMEGFSRYFRKMRLVLSRRGCRRDEIEDLIQDAFVRMLEYCETGVEVRRPEALLVRTAQRLSMNFERDQHRDLYVPEPLENLLLIDPSPAPEDVLAAAQRMEKVKRTLDAVSPRTREVFFMHRVNGLSYTQIADRTGIPSSTVRKHVARAMTVLLSEMQREKQDP
ncbi:RNA polymerase sigma factor [Steroidobacter sp.]|uniref:RNA polymerase sigma factor n=1 Tax=Steroidobacter sp. TaxID=1978227 RepID=UPI001A4B94C2|nr:RNA polymerase sigma factor [Steroidobacter sp.]MBL8268807.1 RNA polymerase sigma factor [Steroidobacter sp.]